MSALQQFAVSDEYRFDPKTGRYRWISGAAKGQLAPRAAVLALTRSTIEDQKKELVVLGDRLSTQQITLRQFQQEAGELLRKIHVASAVLGKGGIDRMTSQDWLAVGRGLKDQYYAGKDVNGRRFGLKWLAQEIQQGKVSPAQLRARLGMYAQSGKLAFYQAEAQARKDAGITQARRLLADSDRSCPDCFAYAGLEWVSLESVVLPTQNCQCRMNCQCSLEYR